MAQTKEQKKKIVKSLEEKIDKQKSIVFVGIKNLKAKEVFNLREKLKKTDCLLFVIKKTLLNIASRNKKIKIDKEKLEGQVALVFGFGDEILPAKTIHQFSLINENLKILGGFFENKFIERDEVIALAKLSSKEELYSKVVGTINAPLVNFLNILQANIRGLVYILSSIKQ